MSGSEAEIQAAVAKLIEKVTQDLGFELEEAISAETRLVADLGLASVDFIQLIVSIEHHYGRKMGFHDLLMPSGAYVDDLTVGELTAFVAEKLNAPEAGTEDAEELDVPATAGTSLPVLDPLIVAAFRASLPRRVYPPFSGQRNSRALFVLTSPRSGSTLLRIILAGHPQLFAPPELHLLDYADLGQRRAALDNEFNDHLLTGTLRALMQLKPCSQDESEKTMRGYEEQRLPTREFYAVLQKLIGNRLLVDKSPIYCLDPAVLKRAEDEFDNPYYLHLVRHPQGMIRSFEDAKIDLLMPFMRESGLSRRQLAELTWLISHENAANFLRGIPAERQMLVRFEDMVQESEATGRALCKFLHVPFIKEMLDPYLEKERRMTDGLETISQYGGDLKFHLHDRIEPNAADRWKQYGGGEALSEMTRQLASSFGYSSPG